MIVEILLIVLLFTCHIWWCWRVLPFYRAFRLPGWVYWLWLCDRFAILKIILFSRLTAFTFLSDFWLRSWGQKNIHRYGIIGSFIGVILELSSWAARNYYWSLFSAFGRNNGGKNEKRRWNRQRKFYRFVGIF